MNEVVRDGDTVVRRAGPWTPTVHRYLRHVRAAGIDWLPEPVETWTDARGIARERLSYLAGDVPAYPLPAWVWAEDVLVDGARRLRRLHDASIGFGLGDAVWQSRSKVPAEVICHNDFAPHNLVFVDGAVVGAIDVDFCSPGPRLWDLAYFALRAVPLTAEVPDGAPGPELARERVATVLRAYGDGHGAAAMTWESVLRVAILRLDDVAQLCREKAVELAAPELLDDAAVYERDACYLRSLPR